MPDMVAYSKCKSMAVVATVDPRAVVKPWYYSYGTTDILHWGLDHVFRESDPWYGLYRTV